MSRVGAISSLATNNKLYGFKEVNESGRKCQNLSRWVLRESTNIEVRAGAGQGGSERDTRVAL